MRVAWVSANLPSCHTILQSINQSINPSFSASSPSAEIRKAELGTSKILHRWREDKRQGKVGYLAIKTDQVASSRLTNYIQLPKLGRYVTAVSCHDTPR